MSTPTPIVIIMVDQPAPEDVLKSLSINAKLLEDGAVQHFGITTNPYHGGYILRDGRMLDFSGIHETDDPKTISWLKSQNMRGVDHSEISALKTQGLLNGESPYDDDYIHEFLHKSGAVRTSLHPLPRGKGMHLVIHQMHPMSLPQMRVLSKMSGSSAMGHLSAEVSTPGEYMPVHELDKGFDSTSHLMRHLDSLNSAARQAHGDWVNKAVTPVVIHHSGQRGVVHPKSLWKDIDDDGEEIRRSRLYKYLDGGYNKDFAEPSFDKTQTRGIPLAITKVTPYGGAMRGVYSHAAPGYTAASNPNAIATSTLGRVGGHLDQVFVSKPWTGDTIHHISTQDNDGGGSRHLIHTINPEETSENYKSYLKGSGAKKIRVEHNPVGQSWGSRVHYTMQDGTQHEAHFFRGRTPTPQGKPGEFGVGAVLKSLASDLDSEARRHYGITTNPKEAGYILRDGSMLDFSGRHLGKPYPDARAVLHTDVQSLPSMTGAVLPENHFMRHTGAVRFEIAPTHVLVNHVHPLSSGQITTIRKHFPYKGSGSSLELEASAPKTHTSVHYQFGEALTPTTLGRMLDESNHHAEAKVGHWVAKAMVETQSPLYNAIGFTNPFGRTYRSAWIHPDGSHEAVPSHASSVIHTGETLHQHQGRTGKVAAGLDGGGAYVRFVGSITPAQHKAVTEYLKTAVSYGHAPWWEATDEHHPGKFTGKDSSRIPASFVDLHKSLNPEDSDVIKAIGDIRYKLPSKMQEGSPEHSEYLKGTNFSGDDPHPDPHGKKFIYEEVQDALKAHPELAVTLGHAPQNLWHDDHALLGLMKSGEFGKHWYEGYRRGLTQKAQESGISPRMLINLFGLNGQGAGLPENISSTLKELARHHAGWYNKGQEHHEMLANMGIRKAASGKPAAWDTLMHVLKGGDLKSKKLGAYGRSFYDPESNPAIDQWIQRVLIGRGEADASQNTVKPHVTIAATGRINNLRDKWNAMHPDQPPVTAPQVQAMLWYGGKHSHADYLERVADSLDTHHPETGGKWSATLRNRAKQIRYDGSWDVSSREHGLDHPGGLPTSNVHHLVASMEPALVNMYHKGIAHTEFYNWHRVADGTSPEAIRDAVSYVRNTHNKYDSLMSKEVKGHKSVEDGHYLYIPKSSKESIADLMAQSGVYFNPIKEKALNGTSKTWIHPDKFQRHMEENPKLLHNLGTLHATTTTAEKTDHPYKLVINDIGHGLAEMAKKAHKIKPGVSMPNPIDFNHSVNHVGKLV